MEEAGDGTGHNRTILVDRRYLGDYLPIALSALQVKYRSKMVLGMSVLLIMYVHRAGVKIFPLHLMLHNYVFSDSF